MDQNCWSSQIENFPLISVTQGGNQGGSNPNAMFNVFEFPTHNNTRKERERERERER